MIDFSTLKFGDTIYNIVDNLYAFSRKKIFKVDGDGVEWYRYDMPIRAFSIQTFTYVGRSETNIFGRVIPDDISSTQYFVENDEFKVMSYLTSYDVDDNDWFSSSEEAEVEVRMREDEQTKIDRS